MRTRARYWSCTGFADWLRGTDKPSAETSTGWYNWRKASKTAHPFRFWLAEEGLDMIQSALWWPIDVLYEIKYYIVNRWVSRTHSLTAHPQDIKPGNWCDVGNRFLPCLFNELVDFVEVELAWWHIAWDKEARLKFKAPFHSVGWFRSRMWRCPEAGIENLEWQANLVWEADHCHPDSPNIGQPTPQAINAREILELYRWWTTVYRNRVDPHEASGWSAYCAEGRAEDDEDRFGSMMSRLDRRDPETQSRTTAMLDKMREMESQYEQEDTEMMIRLIRVRNSLWT